MKPIETVTDIDIDVADRERVLKFFDHVVASIERDDQLVKHNTGVYFHQVPSDPFSNQCLYDHKYAETLGFFKIDFLNLSLYNDIESDEHLDELLNRDILWDLLESDEICSHLHHVNGYAHIMRKLKPKSIEELAMVLALIRPGKKYLYPTAVREGFESIKDDIWQTSSDGEYSFKKSHAIAYATAIGVQLNRLVEKISQSS